MALIYVLVGIIIVPLLVGYLNGCKDIDPETPEGKQYYKDPT